MKIRFGRNDVVDTKAGIEGNAPSLEKLLLITLYSQASAMSGNGEAGDFKAAATVEALTGVEREELMAELDARIKELSAGE